jgi:hypothetical protein
MLIQDSYWSLHTAPYLGKGSWYAYDHLVADSCYSALPKGQMHVAAYYILRRDAQMLLGIHHRRYGVSDI